MAKEKTSTQLLAEEEEYAVYYELNVETINITVESGGLVIFQQGKPKDPPPGP
jgi:hypothetical protein